MRARSLDDDDVVLVAPFDEEMAGEGSGSGSPEFPLANNVLRTAEANHNHVGHRTAHSSSEPSRPYTVGSRTVCLQLPDCSLLVADSVCHTCGAQWFPCML